MGNILCDGGHGCTKFIGLGEDIGVKERFADDAHGEIGHLLIDINDGTIRPGLLNVFTVRAHHLGIASNMARLERGSHEFPLVAVKIALATEDAIAEDRTNELLDDLAFVEVIGMFDQNTVNMFRFVEQDAGVRTNPRAADIALPSCAIRCKRLRRSLRKLGMSPTSGYPRRERNVLVVCLFVSMFVAMRCSLELRLVPEVSVRCKSRGGDLRPGKREPGATSTSEQQGPPVQRDGACSRAPSKTLFYSIHC